MLAGLNGSEIDDDDSSTTSTLTVQYPEIDENGVLIRHNRLSPVSPGLDWTTTLEKRTNNPLSCAFDGAVYGAFGCFPIGLNASKTDFDHVLASQRRLRKLNLLSKLPKNQLHAAAEVLQTYGLSSAHILDVVPTARAAIAQLADTLFNTTDEVDDLYQMHVYSGLDSGFHTPDGGQFWSVWEVESRTSSVLMYLSKSVQDVTGVLLHTHLSRLGFSRYHCFLIEYGLNQFKDNTVGLDELPDRMNQDLQLLSSSDLLLYLQHLQYSEWDEECQLLTNLCKHCEELLIEIPTYQQFKQLSNMDYISGTATEEALVNAKLKWYRLSELPSMDRHDALDLFKHVSEVFEHLLWSRDYEKLDTVTSAIEHLTKGRTYDSATDFVLFCIFSAARKAGFEEVYIEVSDRNPLFNQYTDQSAAFAELFALGSRCEAYFDIKPSDIGLLLSKKHRDYYNKEENQPPMWIFNAPSFASAYAAAQTDIDPKQKASVMPAFRRFTFLSVFAIPALVGMSLRCVYRVLTLMKARYCSTVHYRTWTLSQYGHVTKAAPICDLSTDVFTYLVWGYRNVDIHRGNILPDLHGFLSREHVCSYPSHRRACVYISRMPSWFYRDCDC